MTDTQSTPFDGIPVLGLTDKGTPPPERLKDPATLRSIFTQAQQDDRLAARQRADCQDLLDGGAPYDDAELEAAGAPQTTNLNWGGAADRLEKAMAPYYKMVQSTDELVSVPTKYGSEEDRTYFEQILAEEITATFRKSKQWVTQTCELLNFFVRDAVGVAYFRDKRDFRYRAGGLGQFFFPRQCSTDETEHEVITATDEMGVAGRNSLWEKIEKAKDPVHNGWNVAAVKKAIQHATAAQPPYQDWEYLMAELKNNDLGVSSRARKVRVVHGFIQEFDGTISHYIATEQSCAKSGEKEDFLYVCRGMYRSVNECLTLYTYGIGTNSKLHGLRGLVYKIYAFEQQQNRSLSRFVDASMMASSFMLRATGSDADYANAGYQAIGSSVILDPGFEVANVTMPDLTKSVMPVIEVMRQMRNERTSGYTAEGVFDGDQRKTKYEIEAGLERNAELSDVEQDFFFLPFTTSMQESIRRLAAKDYTEKDPGWTEVNDLRKRLLKRGVPLEALHQIDFARVEVVRGVGGGSAAARTLALSSLEDQYPRMDDVGKANYDWDKAVSRLNSTAQAERYFARDRKPRTTVDTSIAILQNEQLLQGLDIPVLGSDRHLAHAREHVKPLMEMAEMIELGQMESIESARYNGLYSHTVEHVAQAEGDPATEQEVAALNEILQRVGEHISNGLKEAEAAAEEEGQEPQGPSVEDQAKLQEAQAKIDMARETNASKIQMAEETARAKNAIADAVAAGKINRENAVARAKIRIAKKMAAKKAPAKKAVKK